MHVPQLEVFDHPRDPKLNAMVMLTEPAPDRVMRAVVGERAAMPFNIRHGKIYTLGGSMLNSLNIKQRILLNIALNAGVQIYLVSGTLLGWSPIAIMVGCMVLGISALALYIDSAKATGRFMEAVMGGAARMSQGDLSVDVPTVANNVTAREGLLVMQSLQDTLRQMMATLRDGSNEVNIAATEIAAGNQDLSTRTEQGSADLQVAANSMRSLTDATHHSAGTMDKASSLAQSTTKQVRQSGEVVAKAVQAMTLVSQSSRRISDIIGVIDGIAFQTNILALNAAVEAARAGDQGRGFAVVASEVRLLAGRSAAAAKEIKRLITSSVEQVETGSQLVNDAGTHMSEVVASIERVASLISEATQLSRTQNVGFKDLSDSVDRLDHAMQQNAALVEQETAAAEMLKSQAQRLNQLVEKFRLPAGASAPQRNRQYPALSGR